MNDARLTPLLGDPFAAGAFLDQPPPLAFRPVVRLRDGEPYGAVVETAFAFEDTCAPRHMSDIAHPSAAGWLGALIDRACRAADESAGSRRPISVSAPMAALADRDTAMAAEAGARRAGLLPQEVRIDFLDASVCSLDDVALDRLESVMRRGFRIGLDARRSWRTPMGARARMVFEAIRIDPARLEALDVPPSRLEVCSGEGVAIIADNVRWRDAPLLEAIGVSYAVAPRADS